MTIYVLNENFERIALVEDFSSVIWNLKYYSYGNFELVVPASSEYLSLFSVGRYLVRDKDISGTTLKNVMIILDREITGDAENGNNLIVTGFDLKSILARRVITEQTNLYGKPNICMQTLINDNIISPTDTDRAISNFYFGTDEIISDLPTIRMQFTGTNLSEALEKICRKYGLGYDVYLNSGNFIFMVYEGADRSFSQNVNPFVVFSNDFDNLLTSDYAETNSNYANVCIVAGEGEGTARTKIEVGTGTGLNRFEIWLDDRNASTNNGEVSTEDYEEMLTQDGLDALASRETTTSFQGEIINTVNFIFGVDYFLGDKVQMLTDYGISTAPRITEIIESTDENGNEIVPTFEL